MKNDGRADTEGSPNTFGYVYRIVKRIATPEIIRFVISGGTTAATEIAFLYVFTQFFGLWYLFSLVLAFLIALCVSFTLQKFWTFRDRNVGTLHLQAASYAGIAVVNLAVNAALLYVFVQFFGLWYVFGQVLCDAIIAVSSFVIYKFVIFKREQETGSPPSLPGRDAPRGLT